MKKFFKQLFCFHASWAKALWKPYSPLRNYNYYICKDCRKVKNFGFYMYDYIAVPKLPINFDCSEDEWFYE